jgi:hypothetical protein
MNASKLQVMFKGLSEHGKGFGKALFDPSAIVNAIFRYAFKINAQSVELLGLTGQSIDGIFAFESGAASAK